MPAKAKGKRPAFAPDPNVDRLTAMLMALAGEVWVVRERLDTLERLLADKEISRADIEGYVADDAAAAEREAVRAAFLDRVLAIVSASQSEAAAGETPESYQAVVDSLRRG